MERDFSHTCWSMAMLISTHTLTWSVTNGMLPFITRVDISTHTLTWSVTSKLKKICNKEAISTHTLTWSVTG